MSRPIRSFMLVPFALTVLLSTTSCEYLDEMFGLTECGDGKVDAGEECDDGNTLNSDGCNTDCIRVDPGF